MLKNALIFLLLQSRIKLTIEDQEKDIGDRDIALERAFKFYKLKHDEKKKIASKNKPKNLSLKIYK